MTHPHQSNVRDEVIQLLAENGFDGMAQAIEILMDEAMKLERSETLGANPYQRSESRKGHANGFKPKVVNSRLGKLHLNVPQTRDVEFYPTALERGERSERTTKRGTNHQTDNQTGTDNQTDNQTGTGPVSRVKRFVSFAGGRAGEEWIPIPDV